VTPSLITLFNEQIDTVCGSIALHTTPASEYSGAFQMKVYKSSKPFFFLFKYTSSPDREKKIQTF
jgi:hypothetical protein